MAERVFDVSALFSACVHMQFYFLFAFLYHFPIIYWFIETAIFNAERVSLWVTV